ncbi:MAG: N-acyl homoserine lactonase family protein [Lachnospiraceae bacterium]|nr:N-acyl homoserine lactonase family protein [Lachnospiraceae bacterium]
MKNKIYVLDCGTMGADKNMTLMGGVIGTADNKKIENVWVEFPLQAFLIETENDGYILFDTGANPRVAEPGYWPASTLEVWPTTVSEEQHLENQLAKCGVKPEDIKTVVISHCHQDHMGNIGLFKHADVYVPKKEFMNGLTMVHLTDDPNTYGPYIQPELDTRVKQYHLIEEDFELAPGIEVIMIPGHTLDQLGLVVKSDNGNYVIPADALYGPANYGPPAQLSCCFCDSVAFINSIEKIRKIVDKLNAKIFWSHDGETFKDTKKAPEFYD